MLVKSGGQSRLSDRIELVLGVLLLALVALYFPFLKKLVIDWGSNEDYSHGYFIPLVSLYMVYTVRDKLIRMPLSPANSGLVVLILGLALLVVAKIGSELFMQRTSMIVVILGCILFLFGKSYFKLLLLPVCYLFFMIPLPAIIWSKIAFPMQLFGSMLTEHVIRLFGIPIFREGNVLHLSQTTLEVVAACSGLRSLMTMFALSGILAWIATYDGWKRLFLFFSAAPIAIVANIIRLTGTAMIASWYGPEIAHGFLHNFSGLLIFIIGLSLLLATHRFLGRLGDGKVVEKQSDV